MNSRSLTDRLLEAVTTEVQDAREHGIHDSPRVQQRLDAMRDAMAIVEKHESYAASFAKTKAVGGKGLLFRIAARLRRNRAQEVHNG